MRSGRAGEVACPGYSATASRRVAVAKRQGTKVSVANPMGVRSTLTKRENVVSHQVSGQR